MSRKYSFEELGDPLDQRDQVEALLGQLHLARLDLGEIQDLVDQRGEGAARRADRRDIGLLLGVERGGGEKLGHPEDTVQRRAHLVRDAR